MKIVNRKEFMELPDGTVFCKFVGGVDKISMDNYEGLSIKVKTYFDGDNLPIDFGVMQLSQIGTFSRDGMFEEEQRFVIYDAQDIMKIIAAIVAYIPF